MFLSSEIRARSKLYARSYVIFRLGIFALATIIVFIIPYLGDRLVLFFQPDWELLLINSNIGEAWRFLGLSLGVSLVLFILNAPLLMGMFAWMSELTMGRRPRLRFLFSWCTPFSRLFKAIRAACVLVLHIFIEGLKFCALPIAGFVYLALVSDKVETNAFAAILMFLTLFLLVGVVYTAVRSYAYYPALYLLAAVPEMDIGEAFSQCRDFMYVNRAEFSRLILGFIPWYIIENLTFGIGGLFVKPYFYFTLLLFVQQVYNKWLFETKQVPEYVDPLTNLFDEKEDEDV